MNATHIRALSRTEAHRVYRAHLKDDFPDDERKPWFVIDQAWQAGKYLAYGLFRDRDGQEELLAYAFFCMEPERQAALLDYYAVIPEERDHGYGGHFLRELRKALVPERYALLLIEAENPAFAQDEADRTERERRVAFYLRSGAVDTGLRYWLYGVHYIIFALAEDGEASTLRARAEDESLWLYRHMLGEERFAKWFAIENNAEC